MFQRILLFTTILILISPMMADEAGLLNNTTMIGEQNLSNVTGNESAVNFENTSIARGLNQTGFQVNETGVNLTNATTEGDSNLTISQATEEGKSENQSVEPTPTPVYKLSIGSVYESDYKEPEARTFSYSGCQ